MKTYYLAKILKKTRLTSYKDSFVDTTSAVDSECALSNVNIGRYSYVGSGTRITNADIGNFCSIGSKCGIGGGEHPIHMVSTSPVFLKGKNILGKNFAKNEYQSQKKVIIENDVWIGEGVFIKSGITIKNGAIVGAHAVVTHDVNSYEIVAGVPAKVIGKRFDERVIRKLETICWWNWDEPKLFENGDLFTSIESFLEKVDK